MATETGEKGNSKPTETPSGGATEKAAELTSRGFVKWVLERLEIPVWGQYLIVFLLVALTLVFGTLIYVMSAVDRDFSNLDSKITNLTEVATVMASTAPESLRQAIRDMLKNVRADAAAGRGDQVKRSLGVMTSILEIAKNAGVGLSADIIKDWRSQLESIPTSRFDPNLNQVIDQTKRKLLVYPVGQPDKSVIPK